MRRLPPRWNPLRRVHGLLVGRRLLERLHLPDRLWLLLLMLRLLLVLLRRLLLVLRRLLLLLVLRLRLLLLVLRRIRLLLLVLWRIRLIRLGGLVGRRRRGIVGRSPDERRRMLSRSSCRRFLRRRCSDGCGFRALGRVERIERVLCDGHVSRRAARIE